MNSKNLEKRIDTIFMNSENSKTSDPHRLLLNLLRCITRGREGEGVRGGGLPYPFSKIGKSALICGKTCPDWGHLWVKFSFKMQFLRVSRRKNRRFFPYGAFLSCVVGECLSKCPNSKKILLP